MQKTTKNNNLNMLKQLTILSIASINHPKEINKRLGCIPCVLRPTKIDELEEKLKLCDIEWLLEAFKVAGVRRRMKFRRENGS